MIARLSPADLPPIPTARSDLAPSRPGRADEDERTSRASSRATVLPSTSPSGDASVRVPRVLHFATGGFTGATQVAIDLVEAGVRQGRTHPLLVLRRNQRTDPNRVAALRARGLPVQLVPAWPKWTVIRQLVRLCREFRPDVLVAYGFSEHLWGRYAGLLAGVPRLIQVEQGWERYRLSRRWQSRLLARRTTWIVACSDGIRERLQRWHFPEEKLVTIRNAVRVDDFAEADPAAFTRRVPGIVMPARFASSKDHPTLLRAIARLAADGWRPPVLLAGGGKARHRRATEHLARQLGIAGQVQFLGVRRDLPAVLMTHQICVLTTWREGLPLALIEGLAAGCAVIGSDIPGVHEVIEPGRTGWLVPPGDDAALAARLAAILRHPEKVVPVATAAHAHARQAYATSRMVDAYDRLFGAVEPDDPLPATPVFPR